ncbi:hypothetical protein EDB80DRAFT_380065 [Ilyonectria destructans]|nr:hypothetical protein EDB80DRAFT_380065 [Ilyonectria destructans]
MLAAPMLVAPILAGQPGLHRAVLECPLSFFLLPLPSSSSSWIETDDSEWLWHFTHPLFAPLFSPLAAAVRHLRQSDVRSKAQPLPCSHSLPAYFCLFAPETATHTPKLQRLWQCQWRLVIDRSHSPYFFAIPPRLRQLLSRSFRSFRSLIPHLLFPALLFLVDNDEVVALGFQLFNLDPATAQVQPLSNLFSTNIRSQPALGLLLHLAPFQPAPRHDQRKNTAKNSTETETCHDSRSRIIITVTPSSSFHSRVFIFQLSLSFPEYR